MQNEKIEIYFSKWLSFIPLCVFLVGAIYLGFSGAPDEKGFWPIMCLSLVLALFLTKNKTQFSETVIKGMSDRLLMVMICAWLLSGVIGQFLKSAELVETISNLFILVGVTKGLYVLAVFLISALVGTSTGTAVGTVLIVTPILFEAGMGLGCNPYFVLGAILSGAAFGDDFSPLSDTTIAAAETQEVDIGISVKSRLKYALSAAIPSSIIFLLLGGDRVPIQDHIASDINYKSLVMLISPALVVYLCMSKKRHHILTALLVGMASAVIIALLFHLVTYKQIFFINKQQFTAESIIIDGIDNAIGISIFSVFLLGLISFILSTGVIDDLITNIGGNNFSQRKGEVVIVLMTVIVNVLLAHNTITIMSLGPFVKKISKNLGISRLRIANLIDISANTVMHIFPYMITVILASSIANGILKDNILKINPTVAGLHNFHSIFLLLVAIIATLTGLWKKKDEEILNNYERNLN